MKYSKNRKQAFLIEVPQDSLTDLSNISGEIKVGRRKFEATTIFSGSMADAGSTWLTLVPRSNHEGLNAWDWAHELCTKLQDAMGLADPVYVEPDIEQSWPYLNRESAGATAPEASALLEDKCKANGPDSSWPYGGKFAWHLGDNFSQLKAARDAVAKTGAGGSVRITILDTGYDPKHVTSPENLNTDLAYSVIEDIADARDPGKRGLLYNPGHGVGTIGILAGAKIQVFDKSGELVFDDYLGGAPNAEIVPVRVANSVVHLWTSSLAKGIDYAVTFAGKDNRPSDVVSISMGGLPSRLWAEAVNRAYEAGVVIVAAAGNNFGGLPMRDLVWPARFERVIAATGITANFSPYLKSGLSFKMQGNYGPDKAMATAVAAFTPNIPWAELGCVDVIDQDGAGSSSATPQIASVCGLWIAANGGNIGSGWQKVEAVRSAVFSSADRSLPDSAKYFGQGVFKASDALNANVTSLAELEMAGVADIVFLFLHELKGFDRLHPATRKMYEVEAAQLYAKESRLHDLYPGLDYGLPDGTTCDDVVRTFCDLPDISHSLRRFLISALASD